MKLHPFRLTAFILASASYSLAQYTPPPSPQPFPGFVNSFARTSDPSLSNWDFGVNVRFRAEDRAEAGTTDAGSNWDFSRRPQDDNQNRYEVLRVMPRIGYTGSWFSALLEGRSSYSFGDERYNATAPGHALADLDGPLDIYQAYVLFGTAKTPVSFKIGRQELAYGDQRLVGPGKWLNNPRTFDAAKLHWTNGIIGLDAFASSVVYVDHNNLNRSNIQDMFSGLYLSFPTVSKTEIVEAYLYSHNVARGIVTDNWSGVSAPLRFPAPQDLYTAGVRIKSKPNAYGPYDYGIEAMYQFGDRTQVFPGTTVAAALVAPRLEQNAYALIAQAGYTWSKSWGAPRVSLIYSLASGDKNPNDGRSETFQNLFPSNHGLYGIMDVTGLQNMSDVRLAYTVKPLKTVTVSLEGHLQALDRASDFWYNAAGVPRNFAGAAANSGAGYRINPSYGKKLGEEFDLIAGWAPTKYALLEFGLAHYFRGSYVKESLQAVGSNDGSYAFLQVTLNL
jgi:alginate export protein